MAMIGYPGWADSYNDMQFKDDDRPKAKAEQHIVDIIVTTPKQHSATAAKEAEEAKVGKIHYYFRTFKRNPPPVVCGSRVYYVEDGSLRGFATVMGVDIVKDGSAQTVCDTSGRDWGGGTQVLMDAKSWKWIKPVAMKGFQGWRYMKSPRSAFEIVGGWLDPRPNCPGEEK